MNAEHMLMIRVGHLAASFACLVVMQLRPWIWWFLTCGDSEALSRTSKKKCFSNALRHTLVVLEMH